MKSVIGDYELNKPAGSGSKKKKKKD